MSEIQDISEWFALPDDPYFNCPKDVMIRAWKPGDGLVCSSRHTRTPIPCGAPVAVFSSAGVSGRNRTTGVVCGTHAADKVRQLVRDQRGLLNLKTDAQRIAREKVIAAHWDEYQEAIDEAIAQEKDRAFAWLPDSLRAAILANEEEAK